MSRHDHLTELWTRAKETSDYVLENDDFDGQQIYSLVVPSALVRDLFSIFYLLPPHQQCVHRCHSSSTRQCVYAFVLISLSLGVVTMETTFVDEGAVEGSHLSPLVRLPVCLSVYLSICMYVCLSVYMYVCLTVWLSFFLSICAVYVFLSFCLFLFG